MEKTPTPWTIADADKQKQQKDHEQPPPPIAPETLRQLTVKDDFHTSPGLAAIRHGHLQQLLSPKVIMWLSIH
jgi:hypothetical protein